MNTSSSKHRGFPAGNLAKQASQRGHNFKHFGGKRLFIASLAVLNLGGAFFFSPQGPAQADEPRVASLSADTLMPQSVPLREGAGKKKNSSPASNFQLMPAEKANALRMALPQVNSPSMQAILSDPSLFLFTDEEVPLAFQNWSGALPGVHDPEFNISADRKEPFGNVNREFPWGKPFGTHRATGVHTFRFIYLPKQEDGSPFPIVYYVTRYKGDHTDGYAWNFPVGAVVGEVLGLELPDGRIVTFEVRVRIREQSEWGVDVFRPFPTAESLAARIKELSPRWNEDAKLQKLVAHLEGPTELPVTLMRDNQPLQRVFEGKAGVDSLPEVADAELVTRLLTETPFQSCLGTDWRADLRGNRTSAPTTSAAFHIVPRNYDAGFAQIDRIECAQCHKTVGQHADDFDLKRDWYGRVRGSDGIFSFHPFDPKCISKRGMRSKAVIHAGMEQAGFVARFNPALHTNHRYTSIPEFVK